MRLTESELDLIKEAARRDDSSPVVWARDLVLAQARAQAAKRGAREK